MTTTFPQTSFSVDRFRCVKVDINLLKDLDPTLTTGKLEENLRGSFEKIIYFELTETCREREEMVQRRNKSNLVQCTKIFS